MPSCWDPNVILETGPSILNHLGARINSITEAKPASVIHLCPHPRYSYTGPFATRTATETEMATQIPTLTLNDTGLPTRSTKRDYSDSKLKPEPLRLPRKSYGDSSISTQSSFTSPAKIVHAHETPTLATRRPNVHRGMEGMAFLELTPPTRSTAPGLASLVSKFEIADAVSKVNAQETRHGPSPLKPAAATALNTQKQNRARPRTEPRPIFTEGSPFTKPPRIAISFSEAEGPEREAISPRTPTPAAGPKLHDPDGLPMYPQSSSPIKKVSRLEANPFIIRHQQKSGNTED